MLAKPANPSCHRHRALQTDFKPQGCSPRSASEVFRRSQLLWGEDGRSGVARSRSAAALDKLARPPVQVGQLLDGAEEVQKIGCPC